MAQLSLSALAIITILMASQEVSAKRGCSAFGHSCFGGHGKRSSDAGLDVSNPEIQGVRRQFGQDEIPPHPGYSNSEAGLIPGDNMIPIRDGGVYEHDDNGPMRDMMKQLRIGNLFKHWMDNYRRMQQTNDEGLFTDNA